MRKITFVVFLMASIVTSAQTFDWIKSPTVDNDANNGGTSYPVTTDTFGNVYMAGFKDTPYQYSGLLGRIQYNKYNSAGELQYSKLISGRVAAYDLKTDSEGNLIMVAGFNQSIGFENFALLSANQGMKFIVLKFDPQGTLLWHILIDPDNETFINDMNALEVDSNNNIYVGYGDFMDTWITKYSPQGNLQFTIEQTEVNMLTSLSIDNAGNIYAAGSCASNTAHFAGVLAPNNFTYNTYVVKYSPTGNYQWARYVNDITCSAPQVRAFSPDAVYFSSYLFDNYNFDTIQTEGPTQNFSDFFLTKLNNSGDFQWVREVIGNGRASLGNKNFLSLDEIGNVYLAGATSGAVDWGNGISTTSAGFSNPNSLILKYDPNGIVQMAKTVENTGFDTFDGVSVNAQGDIFVSGLIGYGTANFDNLQLEVPQYDYYPVLAKISQATLGNPETSIKNSILYPNPASSFITISNISSAKGSIFNTLGQKVLDFNITNNQPIAISQLAKGAYIIRLEGHKPMKFIKS